MKIIRYKNDGNTVEIINKALTQYNSNVYGYEVQEEYNTTAYLYIFDGKEIAYPLCTTNKNNITAEALDKYSKWDYNTIMSMLDDKTQKGGWTGLLDIDYAKFYGQKELAEKMIANRQNILAKREAEEKAEQQARQEREVKCKAEEEAEKQAKIENGITALKNGKRITAEQFELIAERYNIKMPIKFIGWLREFCGEVEITKHKEALPPNVIDADKYRTVYTHTPKHKSTSIFKYADKIAEAIGIEP